MLKKYEETDVSAIASAIREKTVGDKTYKVSQMSEGVNEVYDAGKKAEHDAFWDMIQNYGVRTDYDRCFRHWASEYIHPKHKVVPTAPYSVRCIFEYCTKLKKIEAKYFDFSQKPRGTNDNESYYYSFSGCSVLEEIEDVGLIAQYSYRGTFENDYKLKKIAKIGSDENTIFHNAFKGCGALQDIIIEGVVGKDISFADSPLLTKASIEIIYAHLKPDTEFTVTFSKTAIDKAFETAEGANDGSTSPEWEDYVWRLPYITFSLI